MKNEKRFGKNYNYNGELSSDYLIKTRGDVVVQSGKKFIKLISGGKINIDVDILKHIDNIDDLENQNNGIYYTESGDVYIKIEDNIISLNSNDKEDGEYVSYLELQNIKDFSIAQKNIKLIIDDITTLDYETLPNKGILFDYYTEKIYYIKNKELIELEFEIPELINHNIQIDGSSILGSLALLGQGRNKGFSVGDTIYIYTDTDSSKIESSINIDFIVGGNPIFTISDNGLIINPNHKLISNSIESNGGNFKIIDDGSESTLYIDNIVSKTNDFKYEKFIELILESKLIPGVEYTIVDFQNEWEIQKDIEMTIYDDIYETDEDENILYYDINRNYPILKYKSNIRELVVKAISNKEISPNAYYKKSGYKVIYDVNPRDLNSGNIVDISKLDINSDIEIDETYKGIILKLTDEFNNTANYDFKNLLFLNPETNKLSYTFNSKYNTDESITGKINNNNIILKDYQIKSPQYKIVKDEFEEDQFEIDTIIDINNKSNILIFNDIATNNSFGEILNSNIFKYPINFTTFDTLDSIILNDEIKYASFHGKIENVNFDKNIYPLLYDLNKQKDIYRNGDKYDIIFIPDLIIPSGFIAMWFKPDIPKGWVICNGENGTPNLIDKFIKGSSTAGNTGGNKEISLTIENLPKHTHNTKLTKFSDIEQSNNFTHDHKLNIGLDTIDSSDGTMKPITFKSSNNTTINVDSTSIEETISKGVINVEVLSNGESKPFEIEPEYYSMIFIMKV